MLSRYHCFAPIQFILQPHERFAAYMAAGGEDEITRLVAGVAERLSYEMWSGESALTQDYVMYVLREASESAWPESRPDQ